MAPPHSPPPQKNNLLNKQTLTHPFCPLHPSRPPTRPAEPMRDFTGLDSLLSPLLSLVVLVTVWSLERCMPGRDILFFLPKAWRETQPLYQLTDEQALKDTAAELQALPEVPGSSPAGSGVFFGGGDGKDPDGVVGGEEGVDGLKKAGGLAAAAGRRPTAADDSAHAGRQLFAGSGKPL